MEGSFVKETVVEQERQSQETFPERRELRRILPRHFQILELYLQGYRPIDIAQVVQMSPSAISIITNSPLFQDEVARRRESREKLNDQMAVVEKADTELKAQQVLEKASVRAAQVHVDLLTNPNAKIAQASANAILDRVVDKKVDRGTTIIIDKAAIELLQLVLVESQGSKSLRDVPVLERKDERVGG